jgi:hypothetical protein
MILQVSLHYIAMSKSRINQYFNPDQHLVLHQDKEGNMIGGGYHVNNLLYQNKMPLFVSLDEAGAGAGAGRHTGGAHNHGISMRTDGGNADEHFIPEKFSDLFKDLAVPAGLFMMPALFRPRNYAFEVPEVPRDKDTHDTDTESDTDSDTDTDDDAHKTKTVPTDIFDTLLSLVTPSERIQHDVKTRRQRHTDGSGSGKDKKRQNKTKRMRA